MTIYLDVSAAVHRRAGLGRYAESLARALAPCLPEQLGLFYNQEQGVQPLPGLESLPAHTVGLGYKPWRMLVWLGHLARLGFNRLLPDATLFHATEHLLLPLQGVPTVLTVHDLIFRHLPEHHKPLNRWYLNLTLPLYCRRASHILAVSEHTRQDLISSYALPPEKISVIYEAADPRFSVQPAAAVQAARTQLGLPESYLLFVGTIEPRKNLIRLLHAFASAHRRGLAEALVVVGKPGWLYDSFYAALERSPVRQSVIFPGYVPDSLLPAVYAGAQALLLPSLSEGFGLPVLEAMACGTPVICSNTSSLPEIAGNAALLVDPTDEEALAESICRLGTASDLHHHLAEAGIARARQFSWDKAARETAGLYGRLLPAA